jgi:hypothetical protein
MSAFLYCYTGKARSDIGNFGSLLSVDDAMMSWLSLQTAFDCYIHPYWMYIKCFSPFQWCLWAYCTLTLFHCWAQQSNEGSFWAGKAMTQHQHLIKVLQPKAVKTYCFVGAGTIDHQGRIYVVDLSIKKNLKATNWAKGVKEVQFIYIQDQFHQCILELPFPPNI